MQDEKVTQIFAKVLLEFGLCISFSLICAFFDNYVQLLIGFYLPGYYFCSITFIPFLMVLFLIK